MTTVRTHRPAARLAAGGNASGPGTTVRVLHLVNGERYAGAERVQDLLALRLPAQGFEVAFGCVKPREFAKARQSRDTPLCEFPMRSRFDLTVVPGLAALIRRGGYKLVHTHTPRTAMVGRAASALAGVPMVHHLHSPTSRDSLRGSRDLWNAVVERISIARAAAVIAVSPALLDYARRIGVPRTQLWLARNGVPTPGPLAEPRRPGKEWVLGTTALFRPRKRVETLVDALSLLRSQGLHCRLRLVGAFESAQYEASLRDRVAKLGLVDAVDFLENTDDVHARLMDMDLFLLASREGEGYPMAILEAMAAGVPVIAARSEGPSEMLGDGEFGVLVSPDRPHEFAAAIERVIHGQIDRIALRRRAYEQQSKHLSDHRMAADVAAVYRHVLGGATA